ncbi:MAG: hypothetical protein ACRC2T_01125, partial [Thermoguttaceae bacterium]
MSKKKIKNSLGFVILFVWMVILAGGYETLLFKDIPLLLFSFLVIAGFYIVALLALKGVDNNASILKKTRGVIFLLLCIYLYVFAVLYG